MLQAAVVPQPSLPRRHASPWGQEKRLEFIDFRLQWDGRLNRSDLIQHFGISVPQASADIAHYSTLAPSNLVYDRSERAYIAAHAFSPVFPTTSADRYLNDLLATSNGVIASESSYLGWLPPVSVAATPVRAVPAAVLKEFIRAMRNNQTLEVLYQSMSRPKPSWRELTPHGIGHDGHRWHARAFCHTRKSFRDFVFARVLEVAPGKPSDVSAAEDGAWFTPVKLVLVPRKGLSESMRRVVELDYAMFHGKVVLETRQAMLYYVLQRLGLTSSRTAQETLQIALQNADEVWTIAKQLAKSYD